MKNIVIDYQKIMETLRYQFLLMNTDNFDIVVEDEQMFNKSEHKNPNCIYIVVHFGATGFNFGQAVINVTLDILSIQNELERTQSFLNRFVTEYNRSSSEGITQVYLSPEVQNNFNEVYAGFRTQFVIQGTFVIAQTVIKLAKLLYWQEGATEGEEVDIISYNDTTTNSLNPEPLPNKKGRTKSYGSFQTLAFNIVTYPDGNKKLIQDLWKMKFDTSESHQNDTFGFSAVYENIDIQMPKWEFKCSSVDFNQKIGETPIVTIAFTL